MSRTKTADCKCPYAPHDDKKCKSCGHYLAHHFNRKTCDKGQYCGECEEDEAKYGN